MSSDDQTGNSAKPDNTDGTMTTATAKGRFKRNRLSLVCQHFCTFQTSSNDWTSIRDTTTELSPKQPTASLASDSNSSSPNGESIRRLMTELQGQLDRLENSKSDTSTNHLSTSSSESTTHREITPPVTQISKSDTINLQDGYSSLILKRSSHEDNKPLSQWAFYKRDGCFPFFCLFLYLYIPISTKLGHGGIKTNWASNNSDGSSKWLNLLTYGEDDLPLRQFAEKVFKERAISKKMNIFPFSQNSEEDGETVSKIRGILPKKDVLDGYLSFFFKNIWPMRPFVEEQDFMAEINRIVTYDPITIGAKLNLSTRSDMANLAILLIILRYSSISLDLMSMDSVEDRYKPLKNTPISVEFINMAHLCLSFYRIGRKTTLTIFQALLLYRYYLRDSPEYGDGLSLSKSQNIMAFIIQSALSMGLNRDPSNFIHFEGSVKLANLRKRLWFGLSSIDSTSIVLNGAISCFPRDDYINVQLPFLMRTDPLDLEQRSEYEKSMVIEKIYKELSLMFNKLDTNTSVDEIDSLLERWALFLKENYQLRDLPKQYAGIERHSRHHVALNYANAIAIERKLVYYSVVSSIYHTLSCHYRSALASDKDKYFKYLKKLLVANGEAVDLSMAYTSGQLHQYVRDNLAFSVSPFVAAVLFRTFPVYISNILHLYHAQELLTVPSIAKDSMLRPEDFDLLSKILYGQNQFILHTLKGTLALKYWTTLKMVAAHKITGEVLLKHKFKCVTSMINFLSGRTDPTIAPIGKKLSEETKKKIREKLVNELSISSWVAQWLKVDGPQLDSTVEAPRASNDFYININQTNFYVNLSMAQIRELHQIITSEFTYCRDFHERCVDYELRSNATHTDTASYVGTKSITDQLLLPREPLQPPTPKIPVNLNNNVNNNGLSGPELFNTVDHFDNIDFNDLNFEFLDGMNLDEASFLDNFSIYSTDHSYSYHQIIVLTAFSTVTRLKHPTHFTLQPPPTAFLLAHN
ncbi:hypothetical protein WICPIJ_007281 [Wickerhamomyces pijperi]|uniref:Nuclease associated modular domain-containing protein n=1 Tax=Wickerhamomyces pijperi TaxID=599730 RepID=A0A9P8Q085_WICPI|nr:hypothetical protein WICPIJ_007281 [Wickerhamomyces pijperi]